MDAGAEYRGYASDVTRTYPIGGELDADQRIVWEAVRRACEAGIDACTPGVEWRDVHRAAALVVAGGLVELGVLRGEPETLLESGAVTLFFPHGVGHMVGLGIRDAGAASDEAREPMPGLPRLRVDIPLEPRHVWTVEPGIYSSRRCWQASATATTSNWDRVDDASASAGCASSTNVLVTDDGCEVLTAAIPV